jgi:hypothetical protein
VLTDPDKTLRIARKSCRFARFDVADPIEADSLVRFAKYGKFFGNALVVINFASRVKEVRDNYEAGKDWNREMFVESLSFASSAWIGGAIADAGSAMAEVAIACFLGATPAGWVLVVAGLGVAAVAAGVSVSIDHYAKKNGGAWYDKIMEWLGV